MVDFLTPSSPTTVYKWTIHDQNACPFCKNLNGQVRSFQYWSFMPAVHDHCRCTLKPVEEKEDQDILRGDAWYLQFSIPLYWNLDGSIGTDPSNPDPAILDPQGPGQNM